MSRPKKNVTPAEPSLADDAAAFLDAVGDKVADAVGAEAAAPAGRSLQEVGLALIPLAEDLRTTVSEIALLNILEATPAQRTDLVRLRAQLDNARADLSTWVDAIDISFRQAALASHADEIPLADGIVKVEAPRSEWVVNLPHLRTELEALVEKGLVTEAEIDALFTTTVTEKADNAKLNYLERHRGGLVADAIARARTKKEGNPMAARLTFQRVER